MVRHSRPMRTTALTARTLVGMLIVVTALMSAGCSGCGDGTPLLPDGGTSARFPEGSNINCICRQIVCTRILKEDVGEEVFPGRIVKTEDINDILCDPKTLQDTENIMCLDPNNQAHVIEAYDRCKTVLCRGSHEDPSFQVPRTGTMEDRTSTVAGFVVQAKVYGQFEPPVCSQASVNMVGTINPMFAPLDIDSSASTITATNVVNGKAVAPLDGDLYLSRSSCPGPGVCPVDLTYFFITSPGGSLSGESFSNVRMQLNGVATGTLTPEGVFNFPVGSVSLTASAVRNGRAENARFRNDVAISGSIAADRVVRTKFSSSSLLGSLTVDVVATLANLPPNASAGADAVVECNGHVGSTIALNGTASSDPDGNISAYVWTVGTAVVARTAAATIKLPLGSHRVTLRVIDSYGAASEDELNVTVVDTTPPDIASFAAPKVCLWSPNHRYAILSTDHELQAVVTDACDPAPRFIITTAVSDQPDDGSGDGTSANDVVRFDDHVCLRAERAGGRPEGRIYSINLVAIDASGNENDPLVQVRVEHDQREKGCPPLEANRFAEEGDARCVANSSVRDDASAQVDGSPSVAAEEPASCSAAGGAGNLVVALATLLGFSARLRRLGRKSIVALVAGMVFVVGCQAPPRSVHELESARGDELACAEGWWVMTPMLDCAASCPDARPGTTCGAADCRQSSFVGRIKDRGFYSGVVLLSRQEALLSVPSGVQQFEAVSSEGEAIEGAPRVTCAGEQLVVGGAVYSRAESDVGLALNRGFSDGRWSNLSIEATP